MDTGTLHLERLNQKSPDDWFIAIGDLHRTQLSAGALAHMPIAFLARFYRMLAESDDCCVMALVRDRLGQPSRLEAFVAGSIASHGLLQRLVRRHTVATLLDGFCLLAAPRQLFRVIEILRQMRSNTLGIDEAQLLSIAVAANQKREGHATRLFAALSQWFFQQGRAHFHIIASDTQQAALAFYRKEGAVVVGTMDLGGLNSHLLQADVNYQPLQT
jgi:ribosomal protein S18 acetylase RimI-like enzyme